MVFDGDLKAKDIVNWLDAFQASMNNLAGSDQLMFTMEIWGKDNNDGTIHERVKVQK